MGDLYEIGEMIVFISLGFSGLLLLAFCVAALITGRIPQRWVHGVGFSAMVIFLLGVLVGVLFMDEGRAEYKSAFAAACYENGGDLVEADLDEHFHCWNRSSGQRIFFELKS